MIKFYWDLKKNHTEQKILLCRGWFVFLTIVACGDPNLNFGP